jgi:hypothetical protein
VSRNVPINPSTSNHSNVFVSISDNMFISSMVKDLPTRASVINKCINIATRKCLERRFRYESHQTFHLPIQCSSNHSRTSHYRFPQVTTTSSILVVCTSAVVLLGAVLHLINQEDIRLVITLSQRGVLPFVLLSNVQHHSKKPLHDPRRWNEQPQYPPFPSNGADECWLVL